jgi:hypothetical protein
MKSDLRFRVETAPADLPRFALVLNRAISRTETPSSVSRNGVVG